MQGMSPGYVLVLSSHLSSRMTVTAGRKQAVLADTRLIGVSHLVTRGLRIRIRCSSDQLPNQS